MDDHNWEKLKEKIWALIDMCNTVCYTFGSEERFSAYSDSDDCFVITVSATPIHIHSVRRWQDDDTVEIDGFAVRSSLDYRIVEHLRDKLAKRTFRYCSNLV